MFKEYLKNPKYIIWDIETEFARIYKKFIAQLYKKIHKYEFEYIETPIQDDYKERTEGIGLLFPLVTVYKVIENHFGFETTLRMKIHEILVDTQQETITVTIKLVRPGLLIGKGGKDVDSVSKRLEKIFGRTVRIHIFEVKKDVNEPLRFYDWE